MQWQSSGMKTSEVVDIPPCRPCQMLPACRSLGRGFHLHFFDPFHSMVRQSSQITTAKASSLKLLMEDTNAVRNTPECSPVWVSQASAS